MQWQELAIFGGLNSVKSLAPHLQLAGQDDMTPVMKVDGKVLNCKILKLQFGAYIQLHRSRDNTLKARSVGAIALMPSNKQGGYWFMSIKTGNKLYGYHWVELPISDEVIERVEQLAEEQGQLLMENRPIFKWTSGKLIVDVDDDVEAMHEEMDHVDHSPDEGGIPIARAPTFITDDDEYEDPGEDRSNDNDKYKGDWTNKLDQED